MSSHAPDGAPRGSSRKAMLHINSNRSVPSTIAESGGHDKNGIESIQFSAAPRPSATSLKDCHSVNIPSRSNSYKRLDSDGAVATLPQRKFRSFGNKENVPNLKPVVHANVLKNMTPSGGLPPLSATSQALEARESTSSLETTSWSKISLINNMGKWFISKNVSLPNVRIFKFQIVAENKLPKPKPWFTIEFQFQHFDRN